MRAHERMSVVEAMEHAGARATLTAAVEGLLLLLVLCVPLLPKFALLTAATRYSPPLVLLLLVHAACLRRC